MVIGKAGKVIRKLTRDVDRIYDLDNPQIDAQEVKKPELNAQMMASRLASSIERGWYFRKAGHNTMRAIMNAGALGCEIVISGKLTGARSRVEKMVSGYIKHAGKPAEDIVDDGFAVAVKKLGTLGCRVRIIHPNAVLPDAYRMKTAEELAASGVVAPAEEAKGAGIEELVEAEGAVAEAEEVVEAVPETTEVVEEAAEAEVAAEEPVAEAAEEAEPAVEIVDGEERREVNGVWQHKHEGHDYWHPMARVHREG
jgi:small subunit ribosomal protein S3